MLPECATLRPRGIQKVPGRPLVGVLGGMGPAATSDFYAKLIAATPAHTDQEHLSVVLWSDPAVPDRSEALLGLGADPSPWLEQGAQFLKSAGCELLAVPCNTAHAFCRRLGADFGLRLVDMVEETARAVHHRLPGGRVGVLATTGTVTSELYQRDLAALDVATLLPRGQDVVMDAIKAVKSGSPLETHRGRVLGQIEELVGQGADAVILACTELPLLMGAVPPDADPGVLIPWFDPTQILAEAVVAAARARPRAS